MRLRTKTLLAVGATFLGLLTVLIVSAEVFVMRGFATLETSWTRQSVAQVRQMIDGELSGMYATCADWAFWDDTYRFIRDSNPAYVHDNLSGPTLANLNLDFMFFVDRGGSPVWTQYVDRQTRQVVTMPEVLAARLLDAAGGLKPDPSGAGRRGLVMVERSPVLIAARPVLKNDLSGPASGFLILGRVLDRTMIAQFADKAGFAMAFFPLSSSILPADFDAVKKLLVTGTDSVVQAQGPDMVAGFGLLDDLDGRPAMIAKVRLPRPVYHQGRLTLRYFVAFFGSTALAIIGIVILFLDQSVLRPLNRLAGAVGRAGSTGRLDLPATADRKDEIGELGAAIEGLLSEIKAQRQDLEAANRRLETDIVQRRQAEAALAEERDHLQHALAQVTTLSGMLPICSHCKQIRNDQGYWERIEHYISQHSGASFSHGICPECMRKYYPEFDDSE